VCEWIGLVWQHDVCPVQCSVHLVHVVDRDSAFGIMICSVLIVLLIGFHGGGLVRVVVPGFMVCLRLVEWLYRQVLGDHDWLPTWCTCC